MDAKFERFISRGDLSRVVHTLPQEGDDTIIEALDWSKDALSRQGWPSDPDERRRMVRFARLKSALDYEVNRRGLPVSTSKSERLAG